MSHAADMRFIEWDTIDLRVSGQKLNELVGAIRVDPIERMELHFSNGLLRVEGSVRKFISVPFTIDVCEITAAGTTVRVAVRGAAAFGAIPIPRFLFALFKDRLPRDLVRLEEPATFVVSLDRFLPPFVSADIQRIWIIDGGLSVTLGRGGADVPPSIPGGMNDPGNTRSV
jgi:hypothetical protein